MRVGGSYPKAFAQEFKDACKQSGVSQSEVFRNVMQETINKIKNRLFDYCNTYFKTQNMRFLHAD